MSNPMATHSSIRRTPGVKLADEGWTGVRQPRAMIHDEISQIDARKIKPRGKSSGGAERGMRASVCAKRGCHMGIIRRLVSRGFDLPRHHGLLAGDVQFAALLS